jgi:competence protein ComEA
MVLGLFALGAAWDLWHVHRPAKPWAEVTPPPANSSPFPGRVPPIASDRGGASRPGPGPAPAVSGRIDLNRADAGELDRLPGIGPVLAGRIVEHRRLAGPYRSVEDLLAVRGIGPALFERLRDRVTIGAADSVPGKLHDPG